MDSTSLISNLMKKSSFTGGLLFLFLGCSQSPVTKAPVKTSEKDVSKKIQNFGPTKKSNTTFADKTKEYGLEGLSAVNFNAIDLNGDGYTDLVMLPAYYSRPKFFIFDPKLKKFAEWSHDPLPKDFKASYLVFHDVNKDGIVDVLAGVLNQKSEVTKIPLKLYLGSKKNKVLSFNESPKALNLPAEPTSSISLIDYNLDGWIDIFVSNWFETVKGQPLPVADRLLKNVKGKFEDVSLQLKDERIKTSKQLYPPNARPTYGASTCDIDQNGYPDILTVSSSGQKNKMWFNFKSSENDKRSFEDFAPVTNYASDPNGSLLPTGGGRSFFSACADYNNDEVMDIFLGELSHAYDNDSVDKSSILTGSREIFPPYFIRTEYLGDAESESWNQGDRRGVWLDYNVDGRLDLLVDNSGFPPHSRLVLFKQNEDKSFENVAAKSGIDVVNPTGTITMDINQDGLPDIITSQNNIRHADIPPRLYVFENQSKKTGKRSIKVHLEGIKSNTPGVGSMVMLFSQNKKKKVVQRRWVEYSQGGLPSQNEAGVIFGVEKGLDVVGFKVRWPYLDKSKSREGEVLERHYKFRMTPGKNVAEVTLCENGRVLLGKKTCGKNR